jgi:beta-lactamase regulating signal transducer with metallopeptidase domain
MNLTPLHIAWIAYFAGSLGCIIAAWWMFLWAWRFVRYAAVITVMTVLLTPYAIDPQTMTMAPALFTLAFEGIAQGKNAILPLIKVMLGIWVIGLILIALFVFLTRKKNYVDHDDSPRRSRRVSRKSTLHPDQQMRTSRRLSSRVSTRASSRGLSHDEYEARQELMKGEIPIRAYRD